MRKRLRISDIYDYCKENNVKMLSPFDADFWEVYNANNQYFDRLFRNSYREFLPFSIDEDADIQETVSDWVFDVYAFLEANRKRYSELWRLQSISDVDYSILDNYNVRESHSISTDKTVKDKMAQKTDTKNTTMQHGQATNTETNSYTFGAKSESDSETLNYGQDRKVTGTTLDVGTQNNTREGKVSADNVSTYSPKDYTEDNLGTRHDVTNETETRDARQDSTSSTHTEQARSDSEAKSHTRGAYSDSDATTNIYGAHEDTHTTDEDISKTVTRKGNIGVFSASKLLSEHNDLWLAFNFYKIIFDEIADELLRIVY